MKSCIIFNKINSIKPICVYFFQSDEELDPEDVEFDEHYTIETRSKCKSRLLITFQVSFYEFCVNTLVHLGMFLQQAHIPMNMELTNILT